MVMQAWMGARGGTASGRGLSRRASGAREACARGWHTSLGLASERGPAGGLVTRMVVGADDWAGGQMGLVDVRVVVMRVGLADVRVGLAYVRVGLADVRARADIRARGPGGCAHGR